jgi:hypothetical protein
VNCGLIGEQRIQGVAGLAQGFDDGVHRARA